jgi:hypothetical protein
VVFFLISLAVLVLVLDREIKKRREEIWLREVVRGGCFFFSFATVTVGVSGNGVWGWMGGVTPNVACHGVACCEGRWEVVGGRVGKVLLLLSVRSSGLEMVGGRVGNF